MHDVALVVFHVSVDVAPLVMGVGFAKRDTIGRGRGFTVIVVVADADPPAPVHVRPKLVVVAGETLCEPDVALEPLQPPEAVHESTLLEVQDSSDD